MNNVEEQSKKLIYERILSIIIYDKNTYGKAETHNFFEYNRQ
jgi:hypothetical protein